MDSSNLAVAHSLTDARHQQRIQLGAVDLALLGFLFFGQLGHLHTLHRHAHRAGRTGNRANGSVQIGGRHVFHLGLGDFFELGAGDLADLVFSAAWQNPCQLDGLLDQVVAGGVLMMKVKLLSAKAVITTGSGRPGSTPWVWALNALQNSMMFRPR
jgi:hypothetical protein